MWESIKKRIAAWVPDHVSPKLVAWVYVLLDLICVIRKSVRNNNYEHNIRHIFDKDTPLRDGFIDNQNEWGDIHFGKTTMAFSGCEVMAVYNVFRALNICEGPEAIVKLIDAFERKGASLQGWMGTSPLAVKKYLTKQGIKTRLVWNPDKLSNPRVAIATIYIDRKNLYSQIHTVALTRGEDGYEAHNSAKKPKGCMTLKDAVNSIGINPKLICAIEILE